MSTPTFTKAGVKATTAAKLPKEVFAVEVTSHELLKQAYLAYQANARPNLAKTLKRGQVSGGGKKPWKQKGTGRARFGSSRVPIWRGGGIVFGPTGNENYSIKLHTAAKRTAIRQALSLASTANKVSVIDGIELKEAKTKVAADLLAKIGTKGRTLIVVDAKTPEQIRSFANLPDTKLATAKYLNVFDILNADSIVLTTDAVKQVTAWLAPTGKAEK